jgi:hypothetical protein
MKTVLRTFAILAALSTLSFTANAALLLGHDARNNLFMVDTVTQSVTLVGSMGLESRSPELEFTPDGASLVFPNTNGTVSTVDPTTATVTGSTAISFPDTPDDNENTATALEYVGNTLYAAFDRAGPETNPGYLGTLNPATGATTGIGTLTGMDAPAGGFAYSNGTMYAVSSANSRFSQLYTIDMSTGAATLIADITLNGNQVEAITALVIADGVAYTKANDDVGGTDQETLYSLDLTTGALTELFSMGERLVALASVSGTDAAVTTSAIPTASQWALVLLVLVLATFGLRHLTRRRAS